MKTLFYTSLRCCFVLFDRRPVSQVDLNDHISVDTLRETRSAIIIDERMSRLYVFSEDPDVPLQHVERLRLCSGKFLCEFTSPELAGLFEISTKNIPPIQICDADWMESRREIVGQILDQKIPPVFVRWYDP